jgi:hypothetical protein
MDNEQGTAPDTLDTSPVADDAPTYPGARWQDTVVAASPDADTQPTRPGHLAFQPEWPVERPARRRADALGLGFRLGVATASLVGIVLMVALVAAVVFVVRGWDAASLGGANGLGELAGEPSATSATPGTTANPTSTQGAAVPTVPTPQLTAPSGQPTAVPTSRREPTPTPIPSPRLSVSPQQATGHCLLGAYPTLVVKNTGGGELTWNARTSDLLVHASPSSGTLATGQAKSIALSGNHVGNTLTVMFSGNGGQATITITCA